MVSRISNVTTYLRSFNNKLIVLALFLISLSPTVRSDEIDGLVASVGKGSDLVNNLIDTVLKSSASEREKLAKYKAANPSKVKVAKNKSSNVPSIQIPSSDVLEVSSKFPKDYLGKYVYGPVTIGYVYDDITPAVAEVPASPALIGFWASNNRPFYLSTLDQAVVNKFKQYKYGTKFFIPRDFPLKIVKKCGFNYVVHMPYEPHFEY